MPARARDPIDDDSGFTLIELLVVILIIGILAAIALPVFLNQRSRGYNAQAQSDLRNAAAAEETYLADNPAGYSACDSGPGATGCEAVLRAPYGWNPTQGTATAIGINASSGFCAVTKSLLSGRYFVYDSLGGGLQDGPASSFAAIVWPTGACSTVSARPAAF